MDVVTRWKGLLDMIECYLEQQQAVLVSDEVRHNLCDIDTLDPADITDSEDIVRLLILLKKSNHRAA